MASLQELGQKINSSKDGSTYIVIIIILVSLASYGLGRLSKIEEYKPPVKIIDSVVTPALTTDKQVAASVTANPTSPIPGIGEVGGGQFVASRNGAKYHFPWCSGAQRIKEENKIWFETKEDAERAGYDPAANCKGL
jgi:competence protein ComEC